MAQENKFDAVRKVGERFRFGIAEGMIETFLVSKWFGMVKHSSCKDLEDQYLHDEYGDLIGRVYQCGGVVHATNTIFTD